MSTVGEGQVALRPLVDADLDAVFAQMSDAESVRMAAFTAPEPSDRGRFDAHKTKVMTSPDSTLLAITRDGALVGTLGSWVEEGRREVTYWVDRAVWGTGVASRALALFLEAEPSRPVYARAASDNVGSLRVLERNGFHVIGTEVAFAPGRGHEIEETVLRLD